MGVDTLINTNTRARVKDVADVIGILAGLKPVKEPFCQENKGWSTKVDGVSVNNVVSPCIPECCEIYVEAFEGTLIDGETSHRVLWHWETEDPMSHLIMPRSTPFWIAVGVRLCKFFGGTIQYNDCDCTGVDLSFEGSVELEGSGDGKRWYALQQAKLDLPPLTMDNIEAARTFAAYKDV